MRMIQKASLIAGILFLTSAGMAAQVSPLQGTAFTQWFGNDGKPLLNGALYFYVAGTTTQAPTYNDPAGTILNANPLPLSTGGRVNAWLVTTQLYKILLCASSSDGPFCSPGNVLAMADQVPGGSAGGGSGSCATGCVGFFVSGTASPATSGTLRLASGDSFCWRNTSGSANLCWSKDSSDVFSIPSAIKMPAVGAPTGAVGFGHLWFDNTANRWKMFNNGGTAAQVVASGNDLSATDAVTSVHFGASQAPFGSTLPSTNQCLQWSGTNIIGGGCEDVISWASPTSNCGTNVLATTITNRGCAAQWYWNNTHTITRLKVILSPQDAGCTTLPIISVQDLTTSTNLTNLTIPNGTNGPVDSGALSITTTAGHDFMVGETTFSSGCTTTGSYSNITVTYQ